MQMDFDVRSNMIDFYCVRSSWPPPLYNYYVVTGIRTFSIIPPRVIRPVNFSVVSSGVVTETHFFLCRKTEALTTANRLHQIRVSGKQVAAAAVLLLTRRERMTFYIHFWTLFRMTDQNLFLGKWIEEFGNNTPSAIKNARRYNFICLLMYFFLRVLKKEESEGNGKELQQVQNNLNNYSIVI